MKLGRNVLDISVIIFKLLNHFKHLKFSSLSLGDSSPTLTLMDGEDSFESIRCSIFCEQRGTHGKRTILIFLF